MTEIIYILIILAFAILVGSTLGFGEVLVFIPIATFFIDVRAAIVLMTFWSATMCILNSVKYRIYVDKNLLKKYLIPGIIGVILGSLLIVIASTRWIELFLGVFVLTYTGAKFYEITNERENRGMNIKERKLDNIPNYLFYSGAFSYSLLGGLIGASGPINVVLLERAGYEQERFIANFSLISLIISSVKLGIYMANDLFPIELMLVFIVGFPVIFIFTKIGHWVTPRITKERFQVIILILLIIIGIRLVTNSLFLYHNFGF